MEPVVLGQRDRRPGPVAVLDRPHKQVEVTTRVCAGISHTPAVRRKNGIHMDVFVVREPVRLPGLHVENLKLDLNALLLRSVDNPFAVGRPVGREVVVGVMRQFCGGAGGDIHFPDRAEHRHGERLAVGTPSRRQGGRIGHVSQVITHCVDVVELDRGIRGPLRPRGGSPSGRDENCCHRKQYTTLDGTFYEPEVPFWLYRHGW